MVGILSRVTGGVARKPIETIGFCTILVVCACYFLWQTIKHDELFAGGRRATASFPLSAVSYVRGDAGKFAIARGSDTATAGGQSIDVFAVAVQQGHQRPVDVAAVGSRRQRSALRKSADEVEAVFARLQTERMAGGVAFGDVCARAKGACVAVGEGGGVLVFGLNGTTAAQAQAAERWASGAREVVEARDHHPRVAPMAFRIVDRVYRLLREATVGEVLLVFMSYALTIGTFINTFTTMRRYGSQITLALSVIFSGFCAFVFALVAMQALGYSINAVLLTEALPFLIICVGFDKSLTLTRSVLLAAYSTAGRARGPSQPAADGDSAGAATVTPGQIQEQIERGVDKCAGGLAKDYLFEIGILAIGVCSGVGQLQEVCLISSFILMFDGVFMFTFYSAVLTLKLDLIRVRSQRKLATSSSSGSRDDNEDDGAVRRGATPALYKKIALKALSDDEARGENRTIRQLKALVLGGFILVSCIESSGYMSGAFSLKSLFSSTRSSAQAGAGAAGGVELTRQFPMLDGVAGPVIAVISGLYPFTAGAGSSLAQLRVRILPVASWHSSAAAAAVSMESSSIVIALLSAGVVLSLGVNVYLVLFGSVVSVGEGEEEGSGAETAPKIKPERAPKPRPLTKLPRRLDSVPSAAVLPLTPASAAVVAGLETPMATGLKTPTTTGLKTPMATGLKTPMATDLKAPMAPDSECRSVEVCRVVLEAEGAQGLSDGEVAQLVAAGAIPAYALEKRVGDAVRAIRIRRGLVSAELAASALPFEHYDYSGVHGQCCENVVGVVPIPVGVAGPLVVDGEAVLVPMATTEGALVASTARGCKAISMSGGATTVLMKDGMTRGPCLQMPGVARAGALKAWLESDAGLAAVRAAFEATSRFAKLRSLKVALAGRLVFVRFTTFTGDAMGMNMISKGCEAGLAVICREFADCEVIAVSGNYCTDKKPAAINWIEGRGKSVAAEAVVAGDVVRRVLRTSVEDLCRLNISKNLVGSAMAGAMGGFNAHAANTLTAIYLATGQDPAQNVEASTCITLMEPANGGRDLRISCTMPSIEVGTVGGGTALGPQAACLDLLGCRGPSRAAPGAHAQRLARIICAAVMAGELSLCSALATGDLVRSHIALNRAAPPPTPANSLASTPSASAVDVRREAAAHGK